MSLLTAAQCLSERESARTRLEEFAHGPVQSRRLCPSDLVGLNKPTASVQLQGSSSLPAGVRISHAWEVPWIITLNLAFEIPSLPRSNQSCFLETQIYHSIASASSRCILLFAADYCSTTEERTSSRTGQVVSPCAYNREHAARTFALQSPGVMFKRTIFRAFRPPTASQRVPIHRRFATEPPPTPSAQSRIERFNRRLPRFLHKYTNALGSAPVSHITAFLILHEITAIVPLLGLAATFHYTHWLPGWFAEGAWALEGVERFGKYFKKKGWIRSEEASEAELEVEMRTRDKAWNIGEGGVRLVVEFATAYTITKILLPLRIVASVWATPWFARKTVVPLLAKLKTMFRTGKGKGNRTGGAGTGATEAGAIPKSGGKGTGS